MANRPNDYKIVAVNSVITDSDDKKAILKQLEADGALLHVMDQNNLNYYVMPSNNAPYVLVKMGAGFATVLQGRLQAADLKSAKEAAEQRIHKLSKPSTPSALSGPPIFKIVYIKKSAILRLGDYRHVVALGNVKHIELSHHLEKIADHVYFVADKDAIAKIRNLRGIDASDMGRIDIKTPANAYNLGLAALTAKFQVKEILEQHAAYLGTLPTTPASGVGQQGGGPTARAVNHKPVP